MANVWSIFGYAAEDDIRLMLVDQRMELTILLLLFDTVTVHGQYCQGRREPKLQMDVW